MMPLREDVVVCVVGADGGLGSQICKHVRNQGIAVIEINGPGDNVDAGFDFLFEDDVYSAGARIREKTDELRSEGLLAKDYYPVLINCVGVNYIDWFSNLQFEAFDKLMALNVRSHLQLVQSLLGGAPLLHSDPENWFNDSGALIEIVSNASHMAMTNSAFYNATKGAQHIATLAMGRELKKTHNLTVFGISPNKLKGTGMSSYIEERVPDLRGWTPEEAEAYQLSSLAAGEETDPEILGEFIAFLVSHPQRHKYLANTVIPYGA